MTAVPSVKADVLVIGGGATGAGVAWDAALRGFDVVLVERGDLAEGTSGRFHGLLHSGGRYAVKDPDAAVECIEENVILRRIAADCIEDTGGLFVTTPDDDPAYGDDFLAGCARQLTQAINVANVLGTVASVSGAQVNADFARADHACLWTPAGAPVTTSLDAQAACLKQVRATFAPALKAYDAFLLVWRPFAFAVRVAEANEVLGRAPSVNTFAALLPDLLRTADVFAAEYKTLAAPSLPTKAVQP